MARDVVKIDFQTKSRRVEAVMNYRGSFEMVCDAVLEGVCFRDHAINIDDPNEEGFPIEKFDLPIILRKGDLFSIDSYCNVTLCFDLDIEAAIAELTGEHIGELIIHGSTQIGDQTFTVPNCTSTTLGKSPFSDLICEGMLPIPL